MGCKSQVPEEVVQQVAMRCNEAQCSATGGADRVRLRDGLELEDIL